MFKVEPYIKPDVRIIRHTNEVRVTHIESGISVRCNYTRIQSKNVVIAEQFLECHLKLWGIIPNTAVYPDSDVEPSLPLDPSQSDSI